MIFSGSYKVKPNGRIADSVVNKSHGIIRSKVVQDIHLTQMSIAKNKINIPEKSAGRLWRTSLIFKVK